jgi:hypothetical protein
METDDVECPIKRLLGTSLGAQIWGLAGLAALQSVPGQRSILKKLRV